MKIIDPVDAAFLGLIADLGYGRKFDFPFIYRERIRKDRHFCGGVLFGGMYGGNARDIFDSIDLDNDKRRARRSYIERNVLYMSKEIARDTLNPRVLTSYIRQYWKSSWK